MSPDIRRRIFDLVVWIGSLVLAGGLLAGEAFAERTRAVADNPTYRTECGACHVPYPPALLPATAWRAQMVSLSRHYGVDASVDASAAKEIGAFLDANAGRERGVATTTGEPPRITTSDWFLREHRKAANAIRTSAAVKSAANCGACHPGADRGQFDEDAVRVPRS
jgi:cytochrome c553